MRTDARVVAASGQAARLAYRAPIKFGGRVVRDALLWDVELQVETRDGRRATGRGSMPLGNIWAWPAGATEPDVTLAAMSRFAALAVESARRLTTVGHPLDLTHELAADHAALAEQVRRELGFSEPMPRLAQLVAASPVEAALHDGYARALGLNAYDVLGPEFIDHDLATWLGPEFRGQWLDRHTLRAPKPRMPLYHLVGALDPLTPGDVTNPVGDGLPEHLAQWIHADGLTHLKIKLNGDDLDWDVRRVVAVEQVAAAAQAERGCPAWRYSLDFNERCADVQYVLDFMDRLAAESPAAWERTQYIEQPTHRDLKSRPQNRMHAAARRKPVVIDESLVDFESLELAREQGYSGVALKACKGHTEALLAAAAAQHFGMFLCVQDLTCPGRSFLHSASLSARIPAVAAIEGNARQYCPAGNRGWADRYPGMFDVRDGTLATSELTGLGLGFDG
jgi:L-alanine-DL-glutamate epimerase-like enolase superfamily enzyme